MAQKIELTREELYRKIWGKPTVKVASEFGISDVGISKICRKMNVPKPPPGYWRRVETGANVEPTSLPAATDATVKSVHLYVPSEDGSNKIDSEIQAMIDREELPENQIRIAAELENAHPLVKKTKRFFDEADANSLEPISPPREKGYLSVSVSPTQAQRALLIMDALLKAAEKRGYNATVSSNHWGEESRIVKEGEDICISLYEHSQKIQRELTPEEKKKPPYLLNITTEYQSSGKLTVKVNHLWSYQKWSDRKNEPLETRLNDVIAGVVALLEGLVAEKRRKEEEERRRQEAARQREEENRRREQLETNARKWRDCQDVLNYLDAYEARLIKEKGTIAPDSRDAEWLRWARDYAESLDPLNKLFSNVK